MARPSGLVNNQFANLRSVSGVIVADSATLTDANFPVASAIDCRGFDTIFLGAEIAGGSSPTAAIECLFRDGDAADGSRWRRVLLGASPGVTATALANPTTGALGPSDMVEMRVYGAKQVFLRISAVTNPTSTTNINIVGMPGQPRNTANLSKI